MSLHDYMSAYLDVQEVYHHFSLFAKKDLLECSLAFQTIQGYLVYHRIVTKIWKPFKMV